MENNNRFRPTIAAQKAAIIGLIRSGATEREICTVTGVSWLDICKLVDIEKYDIKIEISKCVIFG